MIGLSLPYGWLRRDGGLLDLSELLPLLKQHGAHSIEIRTVPADADPAEVLRVAELLWSYGLHIMVHGNAGAQSVRWSRFCGPWGEMIPLK